MTKAEVSSDRRRTAIICAGLALATLLVFWEVQHYDFVGTDDHEYVYDNPMVLAGLSAEGLIKAFFHFNNANWSPLTLESLMLDSSFFGSEP